MMAQVTIDGASLEMEVDTGASASIISEATYNKLWQADNAPQLHPSDVKLRTYTGELLGVNGMAQVTVEYGEQKAQLKVLVVAGNGPSVMGRDWMHTIRLDWEQLHRLQALDLESVLARHEILFDGKLGHVKGFSAKIHIEEGANPRFCKPRSVPYTLRDKVEKRNRATGS